MSRPTLPSGGRLLLGFVLVASMLSALLILDQGPSELLILLMAPIIVVALLYPRRVYLPMLVLGISASVLVILNVSTNPYASFKTLTMLTATTAIMSEVVHWLMGTRMRAITALEESEARYRQIFEHNGAI